MIEIRVRMDSWLHTVSVYVILYKYGGNTGISDLRMDLTKECHSVERRLKFLVPDQMCEKQKNTIQYQIQRTEKQSFK